MARLEVSPDGASVGNARLPFPEQIAFFRNKLGDLVPTARWDDLWQSAHDRAFMVAGATKADLLADFAASIDRAIAEGKSLQAFRKDFTAAVERHDWRGWTGERTRAGRAWRTRIIYQTNLLTSYAAGRVSQLRNAGFRYWVYKHNDSVLHPRPEHQAWDGLTLPPDHAFWQTHYPPGGWGCQCYVVGARSRKAARRLGGDPDRAPPSGWNRRLPRTGAPPGIDKGWDYMPGATVAEAVSALAPKLGRLPPRVVVDFVAASAAQMRSAWPDLVRKVLADPAPRGRMAVIGAMSLEDLAYLHEKGRNPARADITIEDRLIVGRKAKRHENAGDALTEEEWLALAEWIGEPEAVLYDNETGNLLYVFPAIDGRKGKVVVQPDFWHKPTKQTLNSVRTVFKVGVIALKDRKRYSAVRGELKE